MDIDDGQGNRTITGDCSSSEEELTQQLKELAMADPLVKCYGWESLQGFLLASGKVVGLDQSGATRILLENARDVAACGHSADHLTVAIDKDSGLLFQWTVSDPSVQPLKTQLIEDVKFDRIWAGEAHVLALACNGDLYSWGSGRHGQLGHGDLVSEKHPKAVESLQGIRITSAACGSSFSIALSGQSVRTRTCTLLEFSATNFCPFSHSLFTFFSRTCPSFFFFNLWFFAAHGTSAETGDVYTFGLNDHGQLGIGAADAGKRNTAFAQLIEFPVGDGYKEDDSDVNIVKIACGTAHSVIMDGRPCLCVVLCAAARQRLFHFLC